MRDKLGQNHNITNEELISVVQYMLETALKQPGVTDAEVGGVSGSGISAKVRLKAVDVVEFHRDKSLGITVYKGQCKGTASITDLTKPAISAAVAAACRIADHTQADMAAGLAEKQFLVKDLPDLDLYYPANINPEFAIENAKICEEGALQYSKEIENSEGGVFATNDQFYVYCNSRGVNAAYATTRYNAYCVAIAKRNGQMQRDYDFTVARDISDLANLPMVGQSAAKKAVSRLDAKKIKTCQAKVLLSPKVASSFWGTLISAISGGNLFRQSSFLLDTLHTKIFPDFVNIKEDPYIPKALGSAPFDDEGVATQRKEIIKAGVLNTYLLSSYSGRKLGMQTTGNSGGVHNVIVSGKEEFSEILQAMQQGLLVTELLGSGTNIVTGNYSHGAIGFWVENGEIVYPVEEITIAGNLRDMFANILAIGSDVDKRANIWTGSVLLANMTIAGT